jgi:AraC family transcriptional regulator
MNQTREAENKALVLEALDDAAASSAGSWSRSAKPTGTDAATLGRLRAVVLELYQAVSSTLEGERESARRHIERAYLFIRSELSVSADGVDAISHCQRPKLIRGGLAPWQMRCVKTHIESNLDATIRVKELAEIVGLSAFHFCRAFRDSFAASPHGYVMRRRIERAQGLMLTSEASLAQIAAACGLADQAHLNRLFRRFVGQSPGMWRRARRESHDKASGSSLHRRDLTCQLACSRGVNRGAEQALNPGKHSLAGRARSMVPEPLP